MSGKQVQVKHIPSSFDDVFERLEQAFGEYSATDRVENAQHFIDFFTRIRDEGTASIGTKTPSGTASIGTKTPSKRRRILTDFISSNMANIVKSVVVVELNVKI
jgi:flagellar motor component MotA